MLKNLIVKLSASSDGERASSCKNSWQCVKPLLRYGDFLFFKTAAIRHLGFVKIGNVICH